MFEHPSFTSEHVFLFVSLVFLRESITMGHMVVVFLFRRCEQAHGRYVFWARREALRPAMPPATAALMLTVSRRGPRRGPDSMAVTKRAVGESRGLESRRLHPTFGCFHNTGLHSLGCHAQFVAGRQPPGAGSGWTFVKTLPV